MFTPPGSTPSEARYPEYTLISHLVLLSGPILTVDLVLIFLFRYLVLERTIIPRFFGEKYNVLDDIQRRSLINHSLSFLIKILLLVWCAYPFCALMFTSASFHHRGYGWLPLTLGDALVLGSHQFVAMYLHELCYRAKISPIAIAHHVCTVVIAEIAVALTLMEREWKVAGTEFMLCLVWGFFDVIIEGCPHMVIIQKRWSPNDHRRLRNWNRAACIITGIGTIVETVCVMTLFGLKWSIWTLSFKVATPFLHILFSSAQVWGTKNFWMMWRIEERKMRDMGGNRSRSRVLNAGSGRKSEDKGQQGEAA